MNMLMGRLERLRRVGRRRGREEFLFQNLWLRGAWGHAPSPKTMHVI